jgi:uncharacterized alkaline shock family protein YloU
MTVISKEGMAIAPGVVETIVSLAVRDVDGVEAVGNAATGILGLFQNKATVAGVQLNAPSEGVIEVALNLTVKAGYPLSQMAEKIRTAVYEAVLTQVGLTVSRVDITIDAIKFQD